LAEDQSNFAISESNLHRHGNFNLHLPEINTTGSLISDHRLSSQGNDLFFNGSLKLDSIGTELLKLNKIPMPVSGGSFRKFIFSLTASDRYPLLDATLFPRLNIEESFNLFADSLNGRLSLETGEKIPFTVGEDFSFTVPEGIGAH
jgi:hypothetical protein